MKNITRAEGDTVARDDRDFPLRDLSDADRYRVGTNYSELPVKAAHSDGFEFSGHPTA